MTRYEDQLRPEVDALSITFRDTAADYPPRRTKADSLGWKSWMRKSVLAELP
jgi:hypothetical protein